MSETLPDQLPEQSEDCDGCGFHTPHLKFYKSSRHWKEPERRGKWLCALCAGTFAGNAVEYPEQYHDGQDASILFAVCYVGNVILERLAAIEARVTLAPLEVK